MEPLTWAFIGTLIGTLVGASTSIITTYINNQNSLKLEKQKESFNRESSFREFQRENYLKLQETFHKTFRLVSLINIEDVRAFKKTGKCQESELNLENDQNLLICIRDLIFYEERIENDQLRGDLKKIRMKLSKVNNSLNMAESNNVLIDLMTIDFDKLMTDLGTELRLNY